MTFAVVVVGTVALLELYVIYVLAQAGNTLMRRNMALKAIANDQARAIALMSIADQQTSRELSTMAGCTRMAFHCLGRRDCNECNRSDKSGAKVRCASWSDRNYLQLGEFRLVYVPYYGEPTVAEYFTIDDLLAEWEEYHK